MASRVRMWSKDLTIVGRQKFSVVEAECLALLGARVAEGEIAGLTHEDEKLVGVTMRLGAASDLASTLCDADEPWAHLAHSAASGTTVGPVVAIFLLERKSADLRKAA